MAEEFITMGSVAARNQSRTRNFPYRLRLSERRLLLILLDLVMLNGALILALHLRGPIEISTVTLLALSKWFVTLTLVWFGCAATLDCYDLPRASHAAHSARSAIIATLLTVVIYTLIPWLTPPLYSRSLLLLFALAAVGGVTIWRLTYARIFAQSWAKQRALVVGAGHAGQMLAQLMHSAGGLSNPYRDSGYTIVGFIDNNPALHDRTVAGAPVLGGHEQLVDAVNRLHVDEVILAITHRHAISDDLFDALLTCSEQGHRVTSIAAFYGRVLGRVPVEHVGRNLSDVLPSNEAVGQRLYQTTKRLVDMVAGVVMLAPLALLLPLVALANALASPGPLFYRQTRVGLNGKPFTILKLRSMLPDAEQETGAVWAQANDRRVTAMGRWLRRARLDELPQFINILRGEMSMVGPRPERPEFVAGLAKSLPFYRTRHAVRPGLTGWAQVQYEYGRSVDDARIKLEYDLFYVKNVSPLLDLQILFRTLSVVLQMKGS